jgi:hypothetical protein
MATISRRDFLKTTAASMAVGGCAASVFSELSASPYNWPIGIQIFPLRQLIDTDFRGTMKQVADAGFTTVELLSPWYHKNNYFVEMNFDLAKASVQYLRALKV